MNHKSLYAAGMLIAATTLGSVAPAFAAGRDLAVLVVGNGSDKEMNQRERSIIETLTRLRLQRGWNHKILPIYSYHFDKTAERSYCEERLKVKAGDLVLVGLVELESGVPIEFVYRETDVANTGTAADKVMDRARTELAARGRVASATPAPSATEPGRPPATTRPSPAKPPTASASTTHTSPPTATSPRPVGGVTVTTAPITPVLRPATTSTASASTPKPVAPASTASIPKPADPTTVASTPKPASLPSAVPAAPATTTVAVNPSTTTPTAPATNEVWGVQLGLFSTLEKARLAIEKLRQTIPDLQAEIRKGTKDGQVVYRVISGTFVSQAEAYTRAKALAETGVAGFSVKVDAGLGPVVK